VGGMWNEEKREVDARPLKSPCVEKINQCRAYIKKNGFSCESASPIHKKNRFFLCKQIT
jgi:hypothetical protein